VGTELPGNRNSTSRGVGLSAVLGRIVAAAVAVALLALGLMFSLVIFAVALVVGILVFGWLWWKLRRAIRQARTDPRFQRPAPQGDVIEGEVIRGEWQDRKDRHS
jgi:threonine/homoserine/homoserine lactone efflux protein